MKKTFVYSFLVLSILYMDFFLGLGYFIHIYFDHNFYFVPGESIYENGSCATSLKIDSAIKTRDIGMKNVPLYVIGLFFHQGILKRQMDVSCTLAHGSYIMRNEWICS